MKPHANTEALTVVVYAADGKTWVLRRGRRGSMPLMVKELTDIGEKKSWTIELVPDHVTGTMQELNDAYSQYLYLQESGYPLTAERWLQTADKLAGRASEVLQRAGTPKVVVVTETKRPVWATTIETTYGRKMRKVVKPQVKTVIKSHQLVLFG